MIKLLLIVLISFFINIVSGHQRWPVKVAKAGCKFEYKENYVDKTHILEVIEALPFPEMRIETNSRPSLEGIIKGLEVRGDVKNLICPCYDQKGLEMLFPLNVGKKVIIKKSLVKEKVEVLKYRKSPYFTGTNEYLIQHSLEDSAATPPLYFINFDMWWNLELGFYTESKVPKHLISLKLISTNCAPKSLTKRSKGSDSIDLGE